MFRITSHIAIAGELVLKVEGCLAGPCVPALEACWRDAVMNGAAVRVDLTEICHVDRAGEELLTQMATTGVRFTTKGCAMRELVREISRVGALVLFIAVFAAACTLGPNYKRPALETPSAFRGPAGPTPPTTGSLTDTQWFDLFRDDALKVLLTTALERNFELRIAAERVLQARALFRITRGDRFPTVTATADAAATRFSRVGASNGVPADADRDLGYLQAGFSVGWELDVWGRVRRLSESARAEYLAREEARRGVMTTLVADVTETYLLLRSLDLELEIARRTRDVAADSVRLTEARRARGVASGLDVRQAEQLLFTSTGRIASLEGEIAQAENALRLLIGEFPGDVVRGQAIDTLTAPPDVPAGLPSVLLERRPDIRQAEQELIAANARIGAAKADYFPRIALTGFFGTQSRALADLLSGSAVVASAGIGAAAPVLNLERTRGNVRFTEAFYREALVNYERAVYTAFREVADALSASQKSREQRGEQERLVNALRESTRLATERYQSGLDSYLPVLDAQRNLFLGEIELARLRQRELAAVVQLYRALGGGWSPDASLTEGSHG